jgi:hypothetical protein
MGLKYVELFLHFALLKALGFEAGHPLGEDSVKSQAEK